MPFRNTETPKNQPNPLLTVSQEISRMTILFFCVCPEFYMNSVKSAHLLSVESDHNNTFYCSTSKLNFEALKTEQRWKIVSSFNVFHVEMSNVSAISWRKSEIMENYCKPKDR